jgi:hypothetical protein
VAVDEVPARTLWKAGEGLTGVRFEWPALKG